MGLKQAIFGDYSDIGLNNRTNREKWLKKTLSEIPANQTLLDAGAGELKYKPFCKHLKYVSQDFAQYDGKGDGVGIQTSSWDNSKLDIISDIATIPVEDNSFDNILCTEVFEHIPHPIEAIKEFSRILKPTGKLVLTAPFCSLTHFAPYHFYTGFNSYFYQNWLEKYGFEIKEITANGNYYEFISQEIRYSSEVADNYSRLKMGLKEKIAQRILLAFYKRASKKDTTSHSLLNFGFHIVAIKK